MIPTLQIGPVTLGWVLDETDPRWQEFLAAYRFHAHDGRPQLVIEAEIAASDRQRSRPELPKSFIRARRVHGCSFTLGDNLVRGSSTGGDLIRCCVHPVLLSGCGLRVLEQFFYLLYYHAALAAAIRESCCPFLLHSSGVLHQGRAHVFCGPSGSGKSTAASLCPVRPVLSDEALAFVPLGQGLEVIGTPINPFCRDTGPGQGELEGLYLIEHGLEHQLMPIQRADAVPRLTAEVIAPLGLFEQDMAIGMSRALDCALLLYETGSIRRLRFRPDAGFWNLLTGPAAHAHAGDHR